jgi:MarR family transcriptional regulator, 2-MHQ and catechol-resistance regulon repressor
MRRIGKLNNDTDEASLALKLYIVLARTYRTLVDVDQRDIQRYGLNLTEFAVLELLYNKGSHPLQQIGEKILITSGSITYVVDKLERKGLLLRRCCPEDRRVTYAVLTSQGEELLDKIFPAHVQVLVKALGGLDEEEKSTAIRLLKKASFFARELND